MNTNWSTPKTNIFAAINELRHALAAGQNSRLIRARNEDCQHPLTQKNNIMDFRAYEFQMGYAASIASIMADDSMSDFEKELSTNYVNRYGTPEAVARYYETRELTKDNDLGIGTSHLVHIEDYLEYLKTTKQYQRERLYRRQYYPAHQDQTQYFFDFYRLKRKHSVYTIKTFKRKLWVVELLKAEPKARVPWVISILNVVLYPFKYVPKRSVLEMDKYKVVTFRVGDVTNGLSIDIHLPKKFGFN